MGLGHTGLWVNDLVTMRAFYTEVLGLSVTDEDLEIGIVFLSSRPDYEHHEFVLQRGRTAGPNVQLLQQISWRVDSLESLIAFNRRFQAYNVKIQQTVTHGNAIGIYFFDPEGNRIEVYWVTGEQVTQPFLKPIEIDRVPEEILAESVRLSAARGNGF